MGTNRQCFFVTKLAGFEYTKFFTKEALSASNPIPIVRAQNVRMGFLKKTKMKLFLKCCQIS